MWEILFIEDKPSKTDLKVEVISSDRLPNKGDFVNLGSGKFREVRSVSISYQTRTATVITFDS